MLLSNVDFTKIVPDDTGLLRSGIIPYVWKDGEIYFLMGVDTQTGEFSDFGGGAKANENAIVAAQRELDEESRGIIKFKDMGEIRHGMFVRRKKQKMCIMFCEILKKNFFETARDEFHMREKEGCHHEMKDIVWIPGSKMIRLCQYKNRRSNVWSRVRYVLSNTGCFNYSLFSKLK